MAPPTRAAVGRDALIPPHPAPPRTPAGGYGIRPYNQRRARGQPGNRKPCVTSNPCRGRCSHRPGGLYAARTTAGGYGIRPYNQRRARGQPGNRKPCVTSNPCRGRCSHRPGKLYAARTPAGGINPAPTNKFVLWTNRDGLAHPGGCRAGCPHPAAPCAAATPRGRIWNPPLRMVARPAANRENANPAIPQTPVGDDARIVPGDLTPRERPRAG